MYTDACPIKLYPLDVQVMETVEEYSMIHPGDHVLIAVSGGVDSIALLACLNRLAPRFGITLTTAHLNHRIRETEADEDATFVQRVSAAMGIRCVSETIDVKRQASETGRNLEELARQRRYDFLKRTAKCVNAHKIAVGHNLNDQAETVIFRFLRGSGLEGLSAIHPVVDGVVIRPLLGCSRDMIQNYVDMLRIGYREDSSNLDVSYARNRIRRELIPYLQKHFNPRLLHVIAGEAALLRETWDFIESRTVDAYARLKSDQDNGISIDITKLRELHPALQKQVLRLALKDCMGSLRGIGTVHVHSILSLTGIHSGGERIPLPGGGVVVRQFDRLLLLKEPPVENPAFSHTLDLPGHCAVPEIGATFHCSIIDTADQAVTRGGRDRAFLDQAALPPFLTIRSRLPGDRYGGPGHRKVKKMLIDSKVPRLERSGMPMLAAGDAVIWVPGFRPARAYEAKMVSPTCILIEMKTEMEMETEMRGNKPT
jgi:tRNA(Ile)-lysidine synthase